MTDAAAAPFLVFDVGGTHLRAARYDPDRDLLDKLVRRPTPSLRRLPHADPQELRRELYSSMNEAARDLFPQALPERVGVAFAGPIGQDGMVLAAPTIWGRPGKVDVVAALRDLWPGAAVDLLNDVTAAGYAYLSHEREDLCVVTVSSGIGHKVFVGGAPVVGPHGRGGELGHLQVDASPEAPLCECGGRGHLGAVASGTAAPLRAQRLARLDPRGFAASMLAEAAGQQSESIDNGMIVDAFHGGDRWVGTLVRGLARPLGSVLAGVHLAVGVERFVLFGGFALALGPGYRDLVAGFAAESCWDVGTDWDRMVELGSKEKEAGLLGAGRYLRLESR